MTAFWTGPVWRLAVVFNVLVGVEAAALAASERRPVRAPEPRRAPESGGSRLDGYREQEFDAPLEKLDPATPRTQEDRGRIQALSWFMTGQLKEDRNDFRGAYEAYQKAIELDPDAVAVYRALVPLAFRLNKTDEAIAFAQKVVELDPEDYRLLHRLGVFLFAQRRVTKAIELLERAADSTRLDRKSGDYVTIQRDLGLLYGAIGKKDEAADAYEVVFDALVNPNEYNVDSRTMTALRVNPNISFERLGQAFLDAKRNELALAAFEKAAQSRGGKPGNLSYYLALVYFETGKPQKALAELQKYFDAQLQSKGRDAYRLLARILEAQGKSEELLGTLESMSGTDPRNAVLQQFLAEQYLQADRLEEAEALYKRALKNSADTAGYVGLAAVYRRMKRPADLLEALSNALGNQPSPEELVENLRRLEEEFQAIAADEELLEGLVAAGREHSTGETPRLDFAGSFILARLAADGGKTDAAVEFYRHALKARPDRAASIYSEIGNLLLDAERYVDAIKVFREAANDPNLSDARATWLFRLSQALEMNGETEEALKTIGEAQKLIPNNAILEYYEGWIHYHARQWDEAIKQFEQVLADHPEARFPDGTPVARRCQFSLSALYVQKGEIQKGEAILEKILAEEPDDPSVNNDLGYLWADQGKNLQQAEKMVRKAVEAEPENPAYLDSMGWVLYKLGRFQQALTWLEKAAEKPDGRDPTILDHLGDCYHSLEETQKAREVWQEALQKARREPAPDEDVIKRLEKKLNDQSQ